MGKKIDYSEKLATFKQKTLFDRLTAEQQAFLHGLAQSQRFTFQEFRQLVEACRDLDMWGEESLQSWWEREQLRIAQNGQPVKQQLLPALQEHLQTLRRAAKTYPEQPLSRPKKREKSRIVYEKTDKNIFGMCPVASDKTVCCNLRTIDAVENCIFGCSYCTIQTFYSDKIVFDSQLPQKLETIVLNPNRFYHIGTGQSSDSLAWGNRNGNLTALCAFAAKHPNVLLEFKTKSDNIAYFLQHETPPNIVCSWSLNTDTIITNEEHFTAGIDARLQAARAVADRGIKVAFHFHPMVYYENWREDYAALAQRVQAEFLPAEVLFISFGSVTLIKPVLQKIRRTGFPTKITQMDFVTDPHGKLTYADDIKLAMFKTIYRAFRPWHDEVFFYLCMEKAELWQKTFGFVYPDNTAFEHDFGHKVMAKINASSPAPERAASSRPG